MRSKLIFIGLLICGLTAVFSPKFFKAVFPKPQIVEVPVDRIVEKIVYKPFAIDVDEMKLTKQDKDTYILEVGVADHWDVKAEMQSNGKNALVLRRNA